MPLPQHPWGPWPWPGGEHHATTQHTTSDEWWAGQCGDVAQDGGESLVRNHGCRACDPAMVHMRGKECRELSQPPALPQTQSDRLVRGQGQQQLLPAHTSPSIRQSPLNPSAQLPKHVAAHLLEQLICKPVPVLHTVCSTALQPQHNTPCQGGPN